MEKYVLKLMLGKFLSSVLLSSLYLFWKSLLFLCGADGIGIFKRFVLLITGFDLVNPELFWTPDI